MFAFKKWQIIFILGSLLHTIGTVSTGRNRKDSKPSDGEENEIPSLLASPFVSLKEEDVSNLNIVKPDIPNIAIESHEPTLRELLGKKAMARDGGGTLSCLSCPQPDCDEETKCHNAMACYTSQVRDVDGFVLKSKGCVADMQSYTFYCMTKKYDGRNTHIKNGESAQYATACCKENLCNNGTDWPELPDVPKIDTEVVPSGSDGLIMVVAIMVPVVFFILIGIIIMMYFRRRHRKRMESMERERLAGLHGLEGYNPQRAGESTMNDALLEQGGDMTSGSGSGAPRCIERNLANNIDLKNMIGQGRFGQVWRGRYKASDVAVKIFFTYEEEAYKREIEIYQTVLIHHRNILNYVGDVITSKNSSTQYWIVTDFCNEGCLFDYLKRSTLTIDQAISCLRDIIAGLDHLHESKTGTQYKPRIAHRDLKSKNILVDIDRTGHPKCVIADFGLAVREGGVSGDTETSVGTRRYMAPEVLENRMNANNFASFLQADVYQFALIMWEVLRRTDAPKAEEYRLPYHERGVPSDPSVEEMKKVVCDEDPVKSRPEVPEKWRNHPDRRIKKLCQIMCESWARDPRGRLNAFRIRKDIGTIFDIDKC